MTMNYFTLPGILRVKPVSFDDIIQAVLMYTGLSIEEIEAKSRKRPVVFARHLIFYFARLKTHVQLKEIGRRFGPMDHTTVIHGTQRIEGFLDIKDDVTVKAVQDIEKLLKSSPSS